MKWIASAAIVLVSLLAFGAAASAAGVSGPAIYFDGELYRTVGTPQDLSPNAPDDSFDTIYELSDCQDNNVADSAPGERDFNGGRWQVMKVHIDDCGALDTYDTNNSGDLDNEDEVQAAIDGESLEVEIVRYFECPMIPAIPDRAHQ